MKMTIHQGFSCQNIRHVFTVHCQSIQDFLQYLLLLFLFTKSERSLIIKFYTIKVKAVDDDQEPSGQITYSINDIEPSEITKLMTVNKYTGALVLLKSVESLSKKFN